MTNEDERERIAKYVCWLSNDADNGKCSPSPEMCGNCPPPERFMKIADFIREVAERVRDVALGKVLIMDEWEDEFKELCEQIIKEKNKVKGAK